MKVTFLVPYPIGQSPGQRFRFEQWLHLLPDGAVEADIRSLFTESDYARLYRQGAVASKAIRTVAAGARRIPDLRAAGRAEVVFLYREAFPLGPPLLERALESRVPVVFDFDDAIWLGDTSAANAAARRLKQPSKTESTIAGSAVTTVGNAFLASYAAKFSGRVEILPTTIDIDEYVPRPRGASREKVRIGWSGSPTTSRHLRTVEPALRRLLTELPVELVVLGDPDFDLAGLPNVTVVPWTRDTEIDVVSSFDIGIMPLPDDDWSRGKCGFKALLYMSLGVPAVVSPVGVNSDIVSDDENGLLARTQDEWVEAVGSLAESESKRRVLAAAGRQTVIDRYSGQRWAPKFLEILQRAAASR